MRVLWFMYLFLFYFLVAIYPLVSLSHTDVQASVAKCQLGAVEGEVCAKPPPGAPCSSGDRVAPQASGEGQAGGHSDLWIPPDPPVQSVCPAHSQQGRNFQKQAGRSSRGPAFASDSSPSLGLLRRREVGPRTARG